METIISSLQCIYLGICHAFGKNPLYLWTYCSSQHEWGFDIIFRWNNWSPTDVDELHPFFFWVYLSHHSTDNSKVEFRWCYNNINSIFIMKIILLQLTRRAKPIQLYIDTKKPDASSRRIWLEKRNNKNMFKFLLCFIFLTMFPENNLLYLIMQYPWTSCRFR